MDLFTKGGYAIHIHSPEEAEVVYDYYDREHGVDRRYNTSTVENCMTYQYLVISGRHIGANASANSQRVYEYGCKEFQEWFSFVGLDGDDFELDQPLDLSVLFEP